MREEMVVLLLAFYVSLAFSQPECPSYADPESPVVNPNLPEFVAKDITLPAGTLIIPMDNIFQSHMISATTTAQHSWFNLRAYGYVKELRKNKIPVDWAIKNFKAKADADINVMCIPLAPSFIANSTPSQRSFPYGPFVIAGKYKAAALNVLNSFSATPSGGPRGYNVAVYETTEETVVNLRMHLNNRPLIAVSDAGDASIHQVFLDSAGYILGEDYIIVDEEDIENFNTTTCFTTLTEPHFDADPEAYTAPVREFLKSGGNMLAQCHGVTVYETAHFLTTKGVISQGSSDPLDYPNPEVPFVQMDGQLDESQGGSVPDFLINPEGDIINDGFRVAQSQINPNLMQAMSGRISDSVTSGGGVMFYLGGHRYDPSSTLRDVTGEDITDLKQLNGARMYLNAITSDSTRPPECRFVFEGELSVSMDDNPDTVLVGNTYQYIITVYNNECAGHVEDVTTTIILSPLVIPNSLPIGCTYNNITHTVTCIRPNELAPGEEVIYDISVIASQTGTAITVASVNSTTPEFSDHNNMDSEETKLVNSTFTASLDKTPSATIVSPGQLIYYIIELVNTGVTDMTDIVLNDFPKNSVIISGTATVGVFDLPMISWSIAILPPGAIATLNITARVNTNVSSGDIIQNTICITDSNEVHESGIYPCDTANSTVSPLQAQKTVNPPSAQIGDTVTYTLDITNEDTITHTINLSDTLPPELDFLPNSLYYWITSQIGQDTFTSPGQNIPTYQSSIPFYNHQTKTFQTGSYYREFNDGDKFNDKKVLITNGVLRIDNNENPFYGVHWYFSFPDNLPEPPFIQFSYRTTLSGLNMDFLIYPTSDCSGIGELLFHVPTTATPSFSIVNALLPNSVLDTGGPICMTIVVNTKLNGAVFEMDYLNLYYSQPSNNPQPGTLADIANSLTIPPGEVRRWTYNAQVNTDAIDEKFLTNFVHLSSIQLPTPITTSVDLPIENILDIEKDASNVAAAEGEIVTYKLTIENLSEDPRTIQVEDILSSELEYVSNSIEAVHIQNTQRNYLQTFTTPGSSGALYPKETFPKDFLEINDNNRWNSGDILVAGGVLTFAGDNELTGFTIPNLDFSNPNITDALLIYNYRRNGAAWKIENYFTTGSGGRRPLFPSILPSSSADPAFLTATVSLAPVLPYASATTSLEFLLVETSQQGASIHIDNIQVITNIQELKTPIANPPPTIFDSFLMNPKDTLTITYQAIVGSPAANPLINTLRVQDQLSSITFTDQYSLETIQAINDYAVTTTLQPETIPILINDIGHIDTYSVIIVSPPTIGNITVHPITGELFYSPSDYGIDLLTYQVCLSNSPTTCSQAIVQIINQGPPVALDDQFTIPSSTLSILIVLTNDYDIDGDDFYISSYTNPLHGTLSFINDTCQCFHYTPDPGFNDIDTFNYTVTDTTGLSVYPLSTATVTLIINDPIDAIDDSTTTYINVPVIIDVLANDITPDNENLNITSTTPPTQGSIQIINSTIVYTPDLDFVGIDSFTYTIVSDDGDTDTATVTVTVLAPLQAVDDMVTTLEDTPIVIDVRDNDFSPYGNPFLVINVTTPGNGTVMIINNGMNVTYTPNPNFNGLDSFVYIIRDNTSETATATVYINVTAVADPIIANDDFGITNEDIPVSIFVLVNDSNPDGGLLIITNTLPSNGTIQFDPSGNGNVTYTPNTGFNGIDRFNYTITSLNGDMDSAIVTITVIPNDPPVATDDFYTLPQVQSVNMNLLVNDFDPEGEEIYLYSIDSPPSGTLTLNSDDTVTFIPGPNTIPNIVQFNYSITDPHLQTDTALVTIIFQNRPPVAIDDTYILAPGQTLELPILTNDYDPDNNTISISDYDDPPHGSLILAPISLIFTASQVFTGQLQFTYEITDNAGAFDIATVTIIIPPNSETPTVSQSPSNSPSVTPSRSQSPSVTPSRSISSTPSLTSSASNSKSFTSTPSESKSHSSSRSASSSASLSESSSRSPTPSRSHGIPEGQNSISTTPSKSPSSSISTLTMFIDTEPDYIQTPENTPEIIIDPVANDQGNIDISTLIITGEHVGEVVVIDGQVYYYPPAGFVGTVILEYQVCTFELQCSRNIIVVEIYPLYELTDNSSSSEEETWCIGGIVLWCIASVIGFTGLHVSNNGWYLLFLMQIIAVTAQLGINYPQFYMDFASCFGWSVLDFPFPWEVEDFSVIVDGLGGHGRGLLEWESWVDVIGISPSSMLWSNLFWAVIALCLVLLVMFIVFFIVTLVQFVVIRSENHKELVEDQGGILPCIIIEAVEHCLRALFIFIQLIFFGLLLTSFIIIGFYFRNTHRNDFIAPFIVSVIIVFGGLLWIVGSTVAYFFYQTKRWTNSHVIRIAGFFYLIYRSRFGWWNSVSLTRFYLIAGVVGFFLGWGAVQLSLLLAIFIVYAVSLIVFRPYQQKFSGILDFCFCIVVILILVLLFIVWGLGDSNGGEWILRVIIWIFWITVVFYFILLLCYLLFLIIQWARVNRNLTGEERKNFNERFLLFGLGGTYFQKLVEKAEK